MAAITKRAIISYGLIPGKYGLISPHPPAVAFAPQLVNRGNWAYGAASPFLIRRAEARGILSGGRVWFGAIVLAICWLFPSFGHWLVAWFVASLSGQ